MPLSIGKALVAAASKERLLSLSSNINMDGKLRNLFKRSLRLPQRSKTYGININPIHQYYEEEDMVLRRQLSDKGLFFFGGKERKKLIKEFEQRGNETISLGPLYDNKDLNFELLPDNRVKTSFTLDINGQPTVINNISKETVDKGVNFYSLTLFARFINSMPKNFFKDLSIRKKGLIIWTQQDGTKDISSENCLIVELSYDENAGIEVNYNEKTPIRNIEAKELFKQHNLFGIIYQG